MAKQPSKLGGLGDRFPVMGLYDEACEEGSFVASFDETDPALRDLLFKGNQPGTQRVQDMLGEEILIVAWVAVKMKLPDTVDRAGDMVVKSTLILENGETISTMSTGISRSLDLIRTFEKDDVYNPPLRMRLMGTDVGKGGDMLTLQPVMDLPKPADDSGSAA